MVASVLKRGEVAIVSYATDPIGVDGDDIIRFVVLAAIGSGTQIFFSDRNWNGTAFPAASAGEGTFTYTAGADIPAGTVITITSAQLLAAGMDLSNAGETIYVYQGTDANTPTTFLFAMDVGDGNSVFEAGELTGTGLTAGVNAVAVAHDQASYAGQSTQIAQTQLAAISNTLQWHGHSGDDIGGTIYDDRSDPSISGPLNNPDMQLFVVNNGGGQSDAIVRIDNDEASNIGTNLTRLFRDNPAFTRLEDITFDIEDGVWFAADNEGTDVTRIVKGNIADLVSGNPNPTITVVYDYVNNGADPNDDKFIQGIEIDKASNRIFFTQGDISFGHELRSIDYNGGNLRNWGLIDLVIDPSFGFAGGLEDFVVDTANNTAYFSYVLVNAGAGQVLHNYVVRLTAPLNAAAPNPAVENYAIVNIANAGAPPAGYPAGRIPDAEGSIRGMDYDAATNTLWFVTGRLGAAGTAGIFKLNLTTLVYTEVWQQPSNNAHNTPQSFPTTLLVDIEVDSIGGRYYVTSLNSTDTPIGHDGTATDENGSRIWSGSLTDAVGTAPTFFASVFENTANGAGAGMEIDYAPTLTVGSAGSTYTESTNLPNSPAGPTVDVATSPVVNDVDQAIIQGATVAITTGFMAGDTLSFTNSGGITGTYNAVTGVITFLGNAGFAAYQTVLDSVRFTNAGDNPTNFGANPSRTISFTVFDGLINSDPATATVTIVGINDAPVNVVPGGQTVAEDGTRVFNAANSNLISVSDVDANPATQALSVTLTVTRGTLTLSTVAGLSFTTGDGTADPTLVFTGTANAINAALNGMIYTPTLDYHGADTLTFTVNDQGLNGNDPGLTGTGTSEADSDTVAITVTPGVDIANDTVNIAEDAGATNLTLLANDTFENSDRSITAVGTASHGTVTINNNGTPGVTTDDFVVYTPVADYNGVDSFTYTVTSGGATETATVTVNLSAVVDIANDPVTVGEDSGTTTIDVLANDSFENAGRVITGVGTALHGTVAIVDGPDADGIMDYVTYTPVADYNGSDSFTYTVTSGGVTETATVNLTVTAVADIMDDSITVVEDSGANNITNLLANDTFENSGRAITAVGAALHGTTSINNNGTVADLTDDFVVYTPTGNYFGPDSFTYTVTSGGVTETATVTVDVTAVNDPPTNTVPGTLNLSEDAVNIPVAGLQVSDPEAGPAGQPLTVTLSVARGTITISTAIVGGIDATHVSGGAAAASNQSSITITATQAQINATLAGANGLTYTPTANVNGNDTLTIVTSDLGYIGTGGILTDTDMRTLNVGAVNDAPTVGDGTEAVPAINEDTPNTNVTAQTVTQLFGPQFSDATDQVAGGSSANTLLGIAIVANGSNADGTWEWLNGGVWTAIGAATQAAAKTFTAGTQIRFNPTLDFNGTAPTLTAHLVDNSSGSITNGSTVNLSGVGATGGTTRYSTGTVVLSQEVTAVNDGPANTVPGPLTINEDATNVAVTGIQVADIEAGPASQPLTVTLTVAHGTLHVDTTNGAGVNAGQVTGNDSASVTITATQAQINATLAGLNGLTYTPTAHFNGADSLQIVTSDAGFTGTGGTLMDSDAVTINITAINDAPTVSGDGTEDAAPIVQDTPSATGQTVSSLFSPQYSDAADNQVPNGGASSPGAFGGIAVVANGSSPATGQWQYLDVATWTDIGPATTAVAILFDAGTFIRFNPAAGFTGAAPTLTVHLIDNSLGAFSDGDEANLTGATGGTTPYSTGQVVLSQQVTTTNFAPVVDLNDGTPGVNDINIFAEGTSGSGLGTSIAVSDADAGDMIEGATITITDPAAGDELIANLPLPGGITISGASTATTIILIGTASADNYELALGQLGYRNTGNDPTLGGTDTSRSITVTVTDGTANSAPATMTITVFGENDEPTLAATGDNPTFTEDGAAVDLFDPVSASTVEANQTFTSMTLTVTNVTDGANEILSFDGSDVALTNGNSVVGTTTNGLTVNVTVAGNTATVTFSGATLNAASLQALVDAMTYRNTSQNPTDANRAVTITELVDSGSNTPPNDSTAALGIVSTVNVNPTDDAASIIGTASGDVTEAGGTNNGTVGTPTASANLDSTDVDNPNDAWFPVPPGTPSIGGYGTYQVDSAGVWTYTLDDNDPAVQALFGAATLSDTFNATTVGGTAQLVTITIHAKDDFPVAQPDTVTTDEGTVLNGNVILNDADPDSLMTVSEVEGQPTGAMIVLDSGAFLTVNTDGTFSYDPNGMFDNTPTPGSGAVNTPATDTFDYTLTNGNSVTVTVLITGLDSDDVLIGSAGDDVLDAGIGNDIVIGLGGTDEMIGGLGDDQYYVDDASDLVIEQSGGGFDIVYAGANYALQNGEEVEILSALSLGSTDPLHLTGNDLDQEILGNAGANVLRGGGGLDVLAGQGGDDEYYVTEGDERIIEGAGGGRDVVYASVSYALTPGSTQVEVLSAVSIGGTDPLQLTGNEFAQQILGNAGANVLRGGGGADALVGYGGDDEYYVTDGGETIHEAGGDGRDVVYASVDYVLRDGAEVEVLSTVSLGGTAAIDLTGNDGANVVLGNAGVNILDGGGGADTLVGFGGGDTFAFTTALGAGNVDFILDFTSGTDTIALDNAVFTGLGLGALPAGAFVVDSAATDANDRILYNSTTGELFFDADGNGAGVAVHFATVNAGTVLTASDFTVI